MSAASFGLVIVPRPAPIRAFHLVIVRPARLVRQRLGLSWAPMTATRQALRLPWDIALYRARQCLHPLWRGTLYVPTRQAARLPWDIAAAMRQALRLWWALSATPRQALRLCWGGLFPGRQAARLRWGGHVAARQGLRLRWRALETRPARQALRLRWAAPDRAPARQGLRLRWSGESASGLTPAAVVTIAGHIVSPVSLSIADSLDQVAITATLEFARPLPETLTEPGAAVRIDVWGMSYQLAVESCRRSRSFGEHVWTLVASSPAARLQGRAAAPVTGELSGPASAIAARLADDIPVLWDMVDWHVLPGRLVADGESPLDLLRALASAAGGAATSLPDGRLRVLRDPPLPPAAWPEHARVVVDSLAAMLSLDDEEDEREFVNRVTVSDGAEGDDGELRIEEDMEARVGRITEVLVYQTPWTGAFGLRHCGPSAVVLADLGVETRIVADEQIEIVDGAGRAQYPVYAVLSRRWSAVNLGGVVAVESGALTATTPGESILYLSYRTKARRYRVDLGRDNAPPLMLVAESR